MTQTLLLEINNAVSGLEYDWCMTETKVCARCKRELPRDEFTAQPRMKSGLKSYCRKCCGDHARELYRRKAEQYRATRNARNKLIYTPEKGRKNHIRFKYGITWEEYNELLTAQNNMCAICGATEPGGKGDWHIDHSHKTKQIRGILCAGCNIGIGHLGEDPERMLLAAAYLREWSARS